MNGKDMLHIPMRKIVCCVWHSLFVVIFICHLGLVKLCLVNEIRDYNIIVL